MTEYSKELSGLVQTDDFTKDLWLDTETFQVPLTKPATLIDIGINAALEFSDGTDDTCYARVKIPDDMDKNSGFHVFLGWTTSATAGNCRWQIEYLMRSPDEGLTASAEAILVDNYAASTTVNGLVVSDLGAMAAPSNTDVTVALRIKRRADEDADTLGATSLLCGLCLKYLAKQLRIID